MFDGISKSKARKKMIDITEKETAAGRGAKLDSTQKSKDNINPERKLMPYKSPHGSWKKKLNTIRKFWSNKKKVKQLSPTEFNKKLDEDLYVIRLFKAQEKLEQMNLEWVAKGKFIGFKSGTWEIEGNKKEDVLLFEKKVDALADSICMVYGQYTGLKGVRIQLFGYSDSQKFQLSIKERDKIDVLLREKGLLPKNPKYLRKARNKELSYQRTLIVRDYMQKKLKAKCNLQANILCIPMGEKLPSYLKKVNFNADGLPDAKRRICKVLKIEFY